MFTQSGFSSGVIGQNTRIYVLETPGASGDTRLSHAEFSALGKSLMQIDCWEQVVGRECFGGAIWQLCPDT